MKIAWLVEFLRSVQANRCILKGKKFKTIRVQNSKKTFRFLSKFKEKINVNASFYRLWRCTFNLDLKKFLT